MLSGLKIRADAAQILLCRELWCTPATVALIRPLAWEQPYAAGVALKKKKKKVRVFLIFVFVFFLFVCFLGPLPWHMEVPRLGV